MCTKENSSEVPKTESPNEIVEGFPSNTAKDAETPGGVNEKPLEAGTRLKVKFNDATELGFSWYKGTIKGKKAERRYKIEYDDDDEVSSLDVDDEEYQVLSHDSDDARPKKKTKTKTSSKATDKQARMSELLNKLPEDKRKYAEEEGWCDAKIIGWLDREHNPNAFYYRFLGEGVLPKTGGWTPEEVATLKKVCLEKKVNTVGSRPEWGIISRHIPGRVGYACSAAYRKLVDSHEIEDPNYIFVDGKSKYVFGRARPPKEEAEPKQRKAAASPTIRPIGARQSARHQRPKKRRKVRRGDKGEERIYADDVSSESEDEWDLGVKHFNDSSTIDWVTSAAGTLTINPLPNYIDQITGDVVIMPCISPQGYVAGKRTWHAAMEKRNGKCPFTNVKLTHRGLTLLTLENIDEYRDQIKNWEGDRTIALAPEGVADPLGEIYKDPEEEPSRVPSPSPSATADGSEHGSMPSLKGDGSPVLVAGRGSA